jgi:hypothetical protein|tara:strand:- start:723 stop:923 length:201 start_codon:yes stop_codon:yes gene_type:complete
LLFSFSKPNEEYLMPKPSHKKPLIKAIQLSFLMSISYQSYAATDLNDMSNDISEPGTSAQTTVPNH